MFVCVCPVTGCSGALARELAREYPSSTVTVLDLPKVVQTAKQHFSEEGDSTIEFQEGGYGVVLTCQSI